MLLKLSLLVYTPFVELENQTAYSREQVSIYFHFSLAISYRNILLLLHDLQHFAKSFFQLHCNHEILGPHQMLLTFNFVKTKFTDCEMQPF